MPRNRRKRGSGESKGALRDAANGQWENISTRKDAKSNFALTSGSGRADCAPTDDILARHRAHNELVESFRGRRTVRLVKG